VIYFNLQIMENLVLQALGNSEVERIQNIKRNKEFLKRLVGDFNQVYTLYVKNTDKENSTEYSIKKQPNYIATIFFTATDKDCVFRTEILGYRAGVRPEWNIGWIIEKYDTCKGDEGFMRDHIQPHGVVKVEIRFTSDSPNLNDIIKDITRIFDKQKVSKRF